MTELPHVTRNIRPI